MSEQELRTAFRLGKLFGFKKAQEATTSLARKIVHVSVCPICLSELVPGVKQGEWTCRHCTPTSFPVVPERPLYAQKTPPALHKKEFIKEQDTFYEECVVQAPTFKLPPLNQVMDKKP